VPNGVQFIMEVGAFLILTVLVARMSAVDAAAHQMVLHLVNVSFLPAHALAEAAAVLVGNAVGAGRDELVPRVARRALALGAGYASSIAVVYAILGGVIAHALAAGDGALGDRATTLVHVSLAFLVADAANVIARGVLRGASDVRYAAVLGVVTSWLTMPPLAWLFGLHFGLGAVGGWIGLAVEIVVGAALFWRRVLVGGWRPAAAAARRAMVRAV
jgi:MATE family multidrug resistance protein